PRVDTEHLLLGLLSDGGGVAALILGSLGVADPLGFRRDLRTSLANHEHDAGLRPDAWARPRREAPAGGTLARGQAPLCPTCGRSFDHLLIRAVTASEDGTGGLPLRMACCPACGTALSMLP
ncbi:MAG: Clp protease N-terminal domain-containing protein, partial [Acidimicrobiales bacterium]